MGDIADYYCESDPGDWEDEGWMEYRSCCECGLDVTAWGDYCPECDRYVTTTTAWERRNDG